MVVQENFLAEFPVWEAPNMDRPTPFPKKEREKWGSAEECFDRENFARLLTQVREGSLTLQSCRFSDKQLRPPKKEDFPAITAKEFSQLRALGWEAVSKGLVSMVILAGGTSSRLSLNKIFLEVIPGKSLLYIKYMTSRGLAARRGIHVPLCIMTSPFTTAGVIRDLASHGVQEGTDYLLFEQPVAPRFTERGEIISYRGEIQFDVTGHGALFTAIQKSGVHKKLVQWGIRVLIQSNADNPLIGLDGHENQPLLATIGHHLHNKSRITAHVARREPLQLGGVPLWVTSTAGMASTWESDWRLGLAEESQIDPDHYRNIRSRLPYFNPLTLFYDLPAMKNYDSGKLPVIIVRRFVDGTKKHFHFHRFETASGSITLTEPTFFLPDTISGIDDKGMFVQLKGDDQLSSFRKTLTERLGTVFSSI